MGQTEMQSRRCLFLLSGCWSKTLIDALFLYSIDLVWLKNKIKF